jgi:hypothetical protein
MSRQGGQLISGAIKSYLGAIVAWHDYGSVTGTTIIFKHKFQSLPAVMLTPVVGTTASIVTNDVDVDGWYIGATITSDADSVNWTADGLGITA